MKQFAAITYAIIALNVFCFLLSLAIANFQRSEDNIAAQREIRLLLGSEAVSPNESANNFSSFNADGNFGAEEQTRALRILVSQPITSETYVKIWQIQHMNDGLVWEPHWSTARWLAYTPGNPNLLHRFLSLWSAMFMHASLEHIVGNMVFLWVFGRAAEEFLGQKFYLAVYLASGIGAALLHHIVAQIFTPSQLMIPMLGASGANAGVMGLFAVRFFRTKVRTFYVLPWATLIFFITLWIAVSVFATLIPIPSIAILLGLFTAGAGMYAWGRSWAWDIRWIKSAWVVGIWLAYSNLRPALWELFMSDGGDGVAYWAHIGGLAIGAGYAFAIGGVEEGKDEYLLEDAHKSLETSAAPIQFAPNSGLPSAGMSGDAAVASAIALLQKDQNNARAHEILARSYQKTGATDLARRHLEKALTLFLRQKETGEALRLFQIVGTNNPEISLSAPLLWGLARAYSERQMWTETATLLTRIIEEHPAANEAEIALLRSAQLWRQQFDDPAEAARQLQLFLERYPHSPHAQQAQIALSQAQILAAQRG